MAEGTKPDRRKQLGAALRLLRLERQLTQQVVCARSGTSPTGLSQYELGTSEPRFNKLMDLLDAIGVSLTELDETLERVRPDRDKAAEKKVDLEEGEWVHDMMDDQALTHPDGSAILWRVRREAYVLWRIVDEVAEGQEPGSRSPFDEVISKIRTAIRRDQAMRTMERGGRAPKRPTSPRQDLDLDLDDDLDDDGEEP